MAWDGAGNFTRTNGTQSGAATWADADAAGNDITTSQHDTHDEDLADGIAACLTKNGESKPTADFKPNADASYDLGTGALRWRDLVLSGDIAVGGGDISSTATTFNLITAPTTVNAFTGASVALNIGHASSVAAFAGAISTAEGKAATIRGLLDISNASAGQVTFPATQNASADVHTLDDYEEGTWTPVVRGDGTAGTYELAVATEGNYTKIGNVVILSGNIILAASVSGGGTGNLQITGVPFPKVTGTYPIGACFCIGVDWTAGAIVTAHFGAPTSDSTIYLRESNDNAAATYVPISAVAANDQISFTIIYRV